MSRILLWRLLIVCLLCASVSFAETPVEQARAIREAGIEAYSAGNYAKAKALFDSAGALSSSATSMLWSARARAKLNLFLEAMEFYQWASEPGLTKEDPSVERKSRDAARAERDALDRRIPRLRIYLDSTSQPDEVEVTVDGKHISKTLLKRNKSGPFRRGRALKLNPGRHKLLAIKGDSRREVSVNLAEGQKREVRLRFPDPNTVRQRKCRDGCEKSCGGKNQCYLECKRHCFSDSRK